MKRKRRPHIGYWPRFFVKGRYVRPLEDVHGKNRTRDRAIALLREVGEPDTHPLFGHPAPNRKLIHGEGGMGLKDRRVQWLLKRGYVRFTRTNPVPKWSKEFSKLTGLGRHFHGSKMIRRSYVEITEAGRKALRDI